MANDQKVKGQSKGARGARGPRGAQRPRIREPHAPALPLLLPQA
eukprot:CAMPEP_0206010012 /NCGR_PEP_ID=MMETSP1464-20131121/10809_1 /ASSEMBLY_ACC=CAM_ASM_001124 /TAXON_ID=119497 /ORGANISM="Exanthemachrysis gayraliae, Strain RCC1523" /LENGTH=43 /DNA_ID= /DNA_START= /DNA_END= /DNA_ORIENTATION=